MSYLYTTLVLHAHLPYVRHHEGRRIEERWLYEAMAESYIPLLWQLECPTTIRKWTLSLSPPLMEMLSDPLLQQRFLEYIHLTETLLQKELEQSNNHEEQSVIQFYIQRFRAVKETFHRYDQDLINAFVQFERLGKIECITTAASHAFLPYLTTEQGLKAQISEALHCFKRYFGKMPQGFWLPECGYSPEIDLMLSKEGISYTFVEEHALLHAKPAPSKGIGAPIKSPNGVVLFPRNKELSNKIWNSTFGYPGDLDYREFYRDIGYDRDYHYIKPFLPEGIRVDTGLKYFKITGLEQKHYYRRKWAEAKICQHAEDFSRCLENELVNNGKQSYPPYSLVLPFDAELFGHWWFEGPEWLQKILSTHQRKIEFITGSEYVTRHRMDLETCHVSFSSWGRNGYGEVWLNEKNEWIYRHAHRLEKELIKAIDHYKDGNELEILTLKQMVREWLLLTSSDWAFMLDKGQCETYAITRIEEHITNFMTLKNHLYSGTITSYKLLKMEIRNPFLTEIHLSNFCSSYIEEVKEVSHDNSRSGLDILMLSWEFPPLVIGGLSRHVFDLSRAFVKEGHKVTVLTSFVEGEPEFEEIQGVGVYRVQCLQPHATEFLDWIGSLNMALTIKAVELADEKNFDIIHAHDWLVAISAITLKNRLKKPLISTIHATEYGRNNGIYTELQQKIHDKEGELTSKSDAIIVCSDYMEEEVIRLFNLEPQKVNVFPNGVDPSMIKAEERNIPVMSDYKENYSHIVFSVGRIVQEKGFETVIEAAPIILKEYPQVLFLIAGKGPMLHSYQQKVMELGLDKNIIFVGYISDEERNMYFHECDITLFPSLYEPFGIVALEGMAAGKPTIVSETGGLKDLVIHGKTGLRMIPGNKESLASRVLLLLRNEHLAREIGKNGQHSVITTYSWEKIARDTSRLFKEILNIPINVRG